MTKKIKSTSAKKKELLDKNRNNYLILELKNSYTPCQNLLKRKLFIILLKMVSLNQKKAQCFQCQEDFYIKFVIPQQDYSKKNSWEYWTGEKKGKICNSCLKKLYYDKPVYWKTITDLRKRNLLRNYVYEGNV